MPSAARLLDLTRLLSRLGKGQPTGIDRVEAAYLAQFLALPDPAFGLIRSKLGYLLLDRSGMAGFQALLAPGSALPRADLMSRLTRRNDPVLAQAETELAQKEVLPSHIQVTRSKNISKLKTWEALREILHE